jgi:hypothetical protein
MLEPTDEVVRSAAALKLFLLSSLEPDEVRVFLQYQVDRAEVRLESLRAQMAEIPEEWRDNPLAFGRLAAERGLRILPAVQDWAQWGLDQLDKKEN